MPRIVAAVAATLAGLAAGAVLLADGIAQQAVIGRQAAFAAAFAPHDAGVQRLAAEAALFARDAGAAADHARRALRSAPLDVRALRTLGLAEDRGRGGVDPAVTALFNLSARLSWRDRATQLWLLRRALKDRDADGVAQRVDALLRVDPDQLRLLDLVVALGADPAGRAAIVARLADSPAWREGLFTTLSARSGEQVAGWVTLLRMLARTAAPPRRQEVSAWLTLLVEAGHGTEAYAAWSALGPPPGGRGGLIVDPDFTDPAMLSDDDAHRAPFAWHLVSGDGIEYDIGRTADGSGALTLTQTGGGAAQALYQTVVLAPGRYAIAFRASAENSAARARVRLTVSCLGSADALGTAHAVGGAPGWSMASAMFDVPSGCPVQRVAVSLDPGGSAEASAISIRDVRLTKAPADRSG